MFDVVEFDLAKSVDAQCFFGCRQRIGTRGGWGEKEKIEEREGDRKEKENEAEVLEERHWSIDWRSRARSLSCVSCWVIVAFPGFHVG